MVEQALAKELLSSTSSPNLSYLYYLAQFQLLRGNYPSATANLKEVLVHSNQVLATLRVALLSWLSSVGFLLNVKCFRVETSDVSVDKGNGNCYWKILLFWKNIIEKMTSLKFLPNVVVMSKK